MLKMDTGGLPYAWATSWYTTMSAFLCPSDGNNGGRIVPYGATGTYGFTDFPPQPHRRRLIGVPSRITS